MIEKLKNKNIIITGATEGLGKYLSIELSKNVNKLILISRSEKKLKFVSDKCFNKKKHIICPIDLNNVIEIKKNLKNYLRSIKEIDAVLHIAGGGLGVSSSLPDFNDYIKVFNLNLFSIFEINKFVAPLMKKKKNGVLFHIGSIASNESVASLSYNVAKSSLSSYVRSLSKELARFNICVTGINPGGFIYENNSMGRLKKNKPEVYKNFIKNRLPRRKMPSAKELYPIIKLIIENNMMFTGNMITCDSGEGNVYKTF